jgi:hypothetical protein
VHVAEATPPVNPAFYSPLHEVYRSLYPALSPAMHHLSSR